MSTSEPVGASIDPLEFWVLSSSQGTILVVSASMRDVLGWGTEVIGRDICAIMMVRDSQSGMKECAEAKLAKLDTLAVCPFPFRFLSWSLREFASSFSCVCAYR